MKESKPNQKIFIVCLNPYCTMDNQRCLSSSSLSQHSSRCTPYYYPSQEIIQTHWSQLQNYPKDALGVAVKQKLNRTENDNFLINLIKQLRQKFNKSLGQLEQRLKEQYNSQQLKRYYEIVYSLEKVSSSLKLQRNPMYVSDIVNQGFSAFNYQALMKINENFDQIKRNLQSLTETVINNVQKILMKNKQIDVGSQISRKIKHKKIIMGVIKSKFINSLKIECDGPKISFPTVDRNVSFLPWLYSDQCFNTGVHQFKITSIKNPLNFNSGFTIIEESDIDTYPFNNFKSLFNQQGRGFKLIKGFPIHQIIGQSIIVILRIQWNKTPVGLIFDSQQRSIYRCQLQNDKKYRLGLYGGSWQIQVIELF